MFANGASPAVRSSQTASTWRGHHSDISRAELGGLHKSNFHIFIIFFLNLLYIKLYFFLFFFFNNSFWKHREEKSWITELMSSLFLNSRVEGWACGGCSGETVLAPGRIQAGTTPSLLEQSSQQDPTLGPAATDIFPLGSSSLTFADPKMVCWVFFYPIFFFLPQLKNQHAK